MADKPLVLVSDFIEEPLDVEREILGEVAEVVALNATAETDLHAIADRVQAMMMYHAISVGAETLERMRNCRLVVRCGVGIDNIDHVRAGQLGISVANVPDYGTEEVADSAIAMTLSLARGTHLLNSRLRRETGAWSYTQAVPLRRLRGTVFAIIGLGRIGTATALRAKAHGFEVLFYDPYQPQGIDKALGVRRAETLEELVAQAYVLSLHCPLTEETRNIVSESLLTRMPAGGLLINTARGGLVSPDVVLKLLASGHLAGAGLDVLPCEPPADTEPLVQAWRTPEHPAHDQLILNPHSAFYSEQGLLDMRIKGSQNCLRALRNEPLLNLVNRVDS